jgi:putative ABC transport system ATP-binding protein
MIKVENLTKEFIQGNRTITALADVSLEIPKGQITSIEGQSGSGKTTLLALMSGLDRADKGRIEILGNDLTKMSEQELTDFRAKHIGIVFQQFHLMPHLTALENVQLPLEINQETDVKDRALSALEQVGLLDRIHHLPSQLSGGECQRVAIARAFIMKPTLLLADEPSGNLDLESAKRVMDLLFKLSQDFGLTLVLVTHDSELAERCETHFTLRGGKLQ